MPLKAEVILGLLIVIRHRAVRLTGLLVLALVVFAVIGIDAVENAKVYRTILVVGGSLVAVATSRLFAPGPVLAAARLVAQPWWLVPIGRLTGALLVVVSALAITVFTLAVPSQHPVDLLRIGVISVLYVGALGAGTAALTPMIGASASAVCGFIAAWLGGMPPSVVATALAEWSVAQRLAVWLWNGLPLVWRAERWLDTGGVVDVAHLLGWIALGIAVTGWAIAASTRWTSHLEAGP
jgi:hypothetical protein